MNFDLSLSIWFASVLARSTDFGSCPKLEEPQAQCNHTSLSCRTSYIRLQQPFKELCLQVGRTSTFKFGECKSACISQCATTEFEDYVNTID
jgi:hypothetical protein